MPSSKEEELKSVVSESDSSVVSVTIENIGLSSQILQEIGSKDSDKNEPESENAEEHSEEYSDTSIELNNMDTLNTIDIQVDSELNTLDLSTNLPSEQLLSSPLFASSSSSSSFSQFDYYKEDASFSSWSESIEAFVEQLNDVGVDYDTDAEDFIQLISAVKDDNADANDFDSEEEQSAVEALKNGQRFLIYLAVPVLLSQLFMLVILSNSSVTSSVIVATPQIQAVHYHHHHFYYYKVAQENTRNSNKESASKRFFYIFFNPFAAIYNSKYFKQSAEWISRYFEGIKERMMKLNGIIRHNLDEDFIGKALRTRDNWNRAVYDKIYEIAATPQYQRAVGKVSKWASSLKKHFFS